MTTHRLKSVLMASLVVSSAFCTVATQANTLEAILNVGEEKTAAAKQSQAKIDRLAEEARDLLSDYKTVMKQVDGLKVYNARLQRQITNQERRIADIDESISEVTVIQRQMMPLVIRMIDGLEQFIQLDVPFELDERMARLEFLRVTWIDPISRSRKNSVRCSKLTTSNCNTVVALKPTAILSRSMA